MMGSTTDLLGLYKANPTTDGSQFFNIETLLNENWDRMEAVTLFEQLMRLPGVTYSEQVQMVGGMDTWTSVVTKDGSELARCVETERADGWRTVFTFKGGRTVTITETETVNGFSGRVV